MERTFENIEHAFAHKNLKELKQSRFLFKVLFKPWVISLAKPLFKIAMTIHFPVRWIVKPTIYKFFCAGETLSDALASAKKLSNYKVNSILDYAAEETKSLSEAEKNYRKMLEVIKIAKEYDFIAFSVFKPTALCSSLVLEKKSKGISLNEQETREFEQFKTFVDDLCRHSYEIQKPILIDAEYVSTQDIVDAVVWEMMKKYNTKQAIVYNTLQMYRKDRLQYLKNLSKMAEREGIYLGIKLVRGAYLEQERKWAQQKNMNSPVFETKHETDQSYNQALRFCLENISRISVFSGTHNEESNYLMIQWIKELNIQANDKRVYASQLYGMSDHITFNLAQLGYNVAKYMPFGEVRLTIPYLLRRAEENMSIRNQTGRELELIHKAIEIRKKQEIS